MSRSGAPIELAWSDDLQQDIARANRQDTGHEHAWPATGHVTV